MSINKVIVILLQFILACVPLVGQAAALERDNDPEQLVNIEREMCRDCLNQKDPLLVQSYREVSPRNRVRVIASLHQDDLLQELLVPEVSDPEVTGRRSIPKGSEAAVSQNNSRENIRQENLLLKEFTAETSNP